MQKIIELLREHNEIRVIDVPLDIDLEIPHVAYVEAKKSHGGRALLFTRAVDMASNKNFKTPVLMNVFGSLKRTELIFGRSVEGVADEIEKLLHMKPPKNFRDKLGMLGELFALKNVFPKRLKGRGECQDVVYEGDLANLYDIPILTTWSEDGGPFITMGQVYTQSLDGELVNVGMYRLQVYGKSRLGMHWQIHKDSSHFFDQYKEAGKKMPVSIGIGGDPLYTWCAQAPMPYGVNELLLYGLVKKKPARLVKSITTPLWIPEDVDFVVEGWVNPEEMEIEGPFGDHTGYYTLKEPYPVMEVSAITHKKKPIYPATVVGKPPLEDKYMGWGTERIFLPLLKTTVPDLIDYHMPENGVFHNFIMAKMKTHYRGHAMQFMHAFWGVGQMSFVKHAFFVNNDAPDLTDYDAIATYILNRVEPQRVLITKGITDALDHSSPEALVGGKLGVDCTSEEIAKRDYEPITSTLLLQKMQDIDKSIEKITLYKRDTNNPVCVIAVNKLEPMRNLFEKLEPLFKYFGIAVFVDVEKNDTTNPYMLFWRVANNIDAMRDIFLEEVIGIDGTNKGEIDSYEREWPGDVDCDLNVLNSLKQRGVIDIDNTLIERFYL